MPSVFKADPSKGVKLKFRPEQKPDLSDFPGPGTYPARSSLAVKSFSVGKSFRRPLNDVDRSIPGPGQYDPHLLSTTHSWRFGSSNRHPLVTNGETPGPGAYFEKDKDEVPPEVTKLTRKWLTIGI